MIPFLDKMERDELLAFSHTHQALNRRKDARALFDGFVFDGYVAAASALGAYAANRAAARYCQRHEDSTGAEVYEIICRSIYAGLSAAAKCEVARIGRRGRSTV